MSGTPNEETLHGEAVTSIAVSLTEIRGDLGHVKKNVERMRETLEGNGDVGIVLRVDRHHQWIKGVRKFLWAVTGAVVVLLVAKAWELVRGGG